MQQDESNFSANSVRIQFIVYFVVLGTILSFNVIDKLFLEIGKFKPVILYPVLLMDIIIRSIFLYRQWSLLQGHGARTTPGKAVGFGFIPLFCFYWWFVAYAGLAHDTNNYLKNVNMRSPRMSNGLAITYCILLILYFITAIIPEGVPGDIFLSILTVIIGFIFLVQQKNCILAILQDRTYKLQQ